MTQQAYEALLNDVAAALDIERVETDKSGGFVLELDGSRWVSVAYSTPEDKLMCQLCLEATLSPDAETLRYLLRQNQFIAEYEQQHFFSLIPDIQQHNNIVVALLRLPVHNMTPKIFLQEVDRMVSRGTAVESWLLQLKEQKEAAPAAMEQAALKA